MLELFHESLKTPNLPASVMLMIVLAYWIVNLVGFFDFEMFHTDAGEIPATGESSSTGIFDFGDLPISIAISFFSLFFWMGTVLCNHYLGNNSILIGLLIYLPNLVLGFVLARIISIPLSKLYKMLNSTNEYLPEDYAGSICVMTIEADFDSMGQGEINIKGDPIIVNIKASEGKTLQKGHGALLIEYFPSQGYYLAEPYNK